MTEVRVKLSLATSGHGSQSRQYVLNQLQGRAIRTKLLLFLICLQKHRLGENPWEGEEDG